MKISIAMATYNGAQYLDAQLQSFLEQTRLPDELIITDDCSTDQTENIVERFKKEAPFEVLFFRNDKNLGYCGNFNAALSKTSGDLVFLSDQDDVWFPNKIDYMSGLAKENQKALLFMNDAALTDAYLKDLGFTKIEQIFSAGFDMNIFVMGCCCAVRRELLEICLPIPDGYKAHDNWIVGLADALNAREIVKRPLQYYRRHESNESQFIANRTTKVHRYEVFFFVIKSLLFGDGLSDMKSDREQQALFLSGVQRAQGLAVPEYRFRLSELEKRIRQSIQLLDSRIEIMSNPLFFRIYAALKFFLKGGYRDASGIKSMFKDIAR